MYLGPAWIALINHTRKSNVIKVATCHLLYNSRHYKTVLSPKMLEVPKLLARPKHALHASSYILCGH